MKSMPKVTPDISKENPELQLMGSVEEICVIACSKCGEDGEDYCWGNDEALKGFYKEGWRATDKNTYCPKCAKKYLKAKKKK